jgi:hypothetical protein
MKIFLGNKSSVLILGVLSILLVIILTSSLGGFKFKQARSFAYAQENEALQPGGLPEWNGFVFILVFFEALLVIMFFLLPSDQRKKYLLILFGFALAGVFLFLILAKISLGDQAAQQQEELGIARVTLIPETTDTPAPQITPSLFIPPQVSSWTSYLVGLLILFIAIGFWGWFAWRRRKIPAPYKILADITQSTLNDIDAGKDWGDAILNSYQRMNKSVADWRGIQRQVGVTPEEFAAELVSAHLPDEAVYGLTSLFERVRYGDKISSNEEIQHARECLIAILDYCKAVK